MKFSPCIVVPVYNHGAAIGGTVSRLVAHGLPLFVVDDGSDAATQAALAAVAQAHPLVRLARLEVNSGKGAAVMHGLRLAQAAGHSHALQIDADGQHNAEDVPRFVSAAQARPGAVICGRPVYDDSVPRGRLYGRYLTHVWVWIETLSFAVADSMCGFRMYPLDATCGLMDHVLLPHRMDFDTEIIVRLVWRGLSVINLPTRVIYPADGVSHFDMLRDNVRISWMHTRLVAGMLPRAPGLIGRRFVPRTGEPHWSARVERGSAWGLRAVLACYRLLGARGARVLLLPVVGYFFITGAAARRASLDYLRRVHSFSGAEGPAPGWRASWRHMMAFGQSGLDKAAAWSGLMDHDSVRFDRRAELESLLASGRGALLVSAHLGNLEMTRALASRYPQARVNAVVYTDHAVQFNDTLAQINPAFHNNLLQVSDLGPDTAIVLQDKVERGELVVIVGDRTPPQAGGAARRVSNAPFLGKAAPFAHGPFILAAVLGCPVYLFFCLREADGYHIHFEPFSERVVLNRGRRTQDLDEQVGRFSARLQAYCLRAPTQWFNFFDFWKHDSRTDT